MFVCPSAFQHQRMGPAVTAFANLPASDQCLEAGAALIAAWFQPALNLTADSIKAKFDTLTDLCRNELQSRYPSHSIFTTEESLMSPHEIKTSFWKPIECTQIIEVIESVFSPYFNYNFEQYYVKENSFINLVIDLKNGIPITLCITIQAVALRLGVFVECVNFPRHFPLRWLKHPMHQGIHRYSFID